MALTPVPPLAPLYRRVIGVEFDQLPEMVRRLHTPGQACIWEGRADVVRGNSPLGGFLCVIMRMPRAGRDQPLTIAFSTEGEGERWDRRFAGRRMVSHQRAGGGVILERVGPITMVLAPTVAVDGLRCTLTGLRCFGLPLPAFVVPNATTFEFEEAGCYRFEIEASLAGLGLLVRYSGWLAPVSGESTCSSPPSPHRTSGR